MRHEEFQYLDLMERILETGDERLDRTGVGTRSVFGAMMRFDLSDGSVPIFTTKRVFWKAALREMLWFLSGNTNIRPLLQQGVTIWTDWPLKAYREQTGDRIEQKAFEARIVEDEAFARQWGDLGPVYGKQWRDWRGPDGRRYDQIADLITMLRETPTSRRMLFHGWNVPELASMALPPCHTLYQCYVSSGDRSSNSRLSLLIYMRSNDLLLGTPFNIFGGAALLRMLANQAGLMPGELIYMGADAHLYLNHLDQAREQITREPRPFPKLEIAPGVASIDDYRFEHFTVTGYDPHPAIKADVAV